MSETKEQVHRSVLHRWAFYSNDRLAFCGLACQTGAQALLLNLIETEQYADSEPLPRRMRVEQQIRDQIRSHVRETMGPEWSVTIRFDSRRVDEAWLVKAFLQATEPPALVVG